MLCGRVFDLLGVIKLIPPWQQPYGYGDWALGDPGLDLSFKADDVLPEAGQPFCEDENGRASCARPRPKSLQRGDETYTVDIRWHTL